MREWQSIRWQLILCSVGVTLLTALLLVLVALGAIFSYYENTQRSRVISLAQEGAPLIVKEAHGSSTSAIVLSAIPSISAQQWLDSPYLVTAFNTDAQVIYTNITGSSEMPLPPQPTPATTLTMSAHGKAMVVSTAEKSDKATKVLAWLSSKQVPFVKPLSPADLLTLRSAITNGLNGSATTGTIGSGFATQPFSVQPFSRPVEPITGVIVALALSSANDVIPSFLDTVGGAVLLASPLLAVLVALITLGFSRTLTRPLALLTKATRHLATGDYQVQVPSNAPGELGELARHFHKMATQLQHQELWQRELMMNITHDLATPLTAIAGLGEALMDGMNVNQKENEETGEIIVRETRRLHRLVQDLHTMIKVEAKTFQPQLQPVCLSLLINEVLAMLAPAFEHVNVEARNLIAPTLPDLQADPDMLKRVFSNLCDNALRHTTAAGFITFEARKQENTLLISVTDSGTGIPPEALTRIFERFFCLDKARHSQASGSGLGLAIARAIVESHHGQIYAENAPEAGARFIMTLPCVSNG